jgi:hypothetical protein
MPFSVYPFEFSIASILYYNNYINGCKLVLGNKMRNYKIMSDLSC